MSVTARPAPPSLVDVLQQQHLERRTLSFAVSGGTLHFRRGNLVHAAYGRLVGIEALREILAGPAQLLSVHEAELIQVTISKPFRLALLEALGQLDERER